MELKPDYLKLKDLLDNRLFKIPDYQRPYSWTSIERRALFNDIYAAKKKDETHFMATVVYVKTKTKEKIGSNEYFVYDIVDGQQRLTTLIILLKSIQQHLDKKNKEEKEECEELQNKILVRGKAKEKQLILLQTNHNEANAFEQFLLNGTILKKDSIKTLPLKNLNDAFRETKIFVEEWKKEYALIDLLYLVKNGLAFLVYDLNNEKAVYTVFEVLNSRGLPVIYLDKTKSILMSSAYELLSNSDTSLNRYTSSIKETWTKVYDLLGIKDFSSDDIIKYVGTFLHPTIKGKPISCDESIDLLSNLARSDIDNIPKVNKLILDVASHLKDMVSNTRLDFFSSITQLRFFYVALCINEILSQQEKNEIIEVWENISFKIYGLFGKDAKYKVGDFIRLAREIYDCNITFPQEYDNSKKTEFESKSLKDKIIDKLLFVGEDYKLDKIEDEFEGRDCYNDWYVELKYLFYRMDMLFAQKLSKGKKQSPSKNWSAIFELPIKDTIEHIIPKEKTSNWAGKTGKGNKYEKAVNRIGNLLLLPQGLNSECGTKIFSDKKNIYSKSLLHISNDVVYVDYIKGGKKERIDWDFDEILKREKRLFEYIKEIF